MYVYLSLSGSTRGRITGPRPRPRLTHNRTGTHLMERGGAVHVSLVMHHGGGGGRGVIVAADGRGGGVLVASGDGLLSLDLAEALEVNFERFHVVLESQGCHRPQKVIAVDCLALLALALVGSFAGDETYELRHAFLHGLFGVLGDLGVRRQSLFHDPADVGDWKEAVLFPRRQLAEAAVPGVLRSPRVVVRVSHGRLSDDSEGSTNSTLYSAFS